MEILIYRRQRVDYGEQDYTTCLVPQFACYAAGLRKFDPKGSQGNNQELLPSRGSSKDYANTQNPI